MKIIKGYTIDEVVPEGAEYLTSTTGWISMHYFLVEVLVKVEENEL